MRFTICMSCLSLFCVQAVAEAGLIFATDPQFSSSINRSPFLVPLVTANGTLQLDLVTENEILVNGVGRAKFRLEGNNTETLILESWTSATADAVSRINVFLSFTLQPTGAENPGDPVTLYLHLTKPTQVLNPLITNVGGDPVPDGLRVVNGFRNSGVDYFFDSVGTISIDTTLGSAFTLGYESSAKGLPVGDIGLAMSFSASPPPPPQTMGIPEAVPEPSTYVLLSLGILTFLAQHFKKRIRI